MLKFKNQFYCFLPDCLQNLLITIYNLNSYHYRYRGNYWRFRNEFLQNDRLTRPQLESIQFTKAKDFLDYAITNSQYYSEIIDPSLVKDFDDIDKIRLLPLLKKETLRKNIDKIITIPKSKGIISKTGGTTGISLEVIFTKSDIQARFAFVDNLRSIFGYRLGEKTAWFSGKNLLNKRDLKRKRFWKTDFFHNVRYYSTYQIKQGNIEYYLQNIISYSPKYFIGFPSTMFDLASFGLNNNIDFPKCLKAIFPNAETITFEMRSTITRFFKCDIYDQYSSSEGAPFIFECKNHKYHIELQSGIFEVLDEKNKPSNDGRLIVTSFYTHGTPLIRYEIGDIIGLSEDTCGCGNENPVISYIAGRENDFIYSKDTGKINAGNISNCTKGTRGIIKFQIIQNHIDEVRVKIVIDKLQFDSTDQAVFMRNLRDRLGNKIKIDMEYCQNIDLEKSGKYRLILNNIKSEIEN